jgi:S-adenosylmethionine:tRNA ribosyltransferase-isomerase
MASSYDFHLPDALIAQSPPQRRGDSRLLLVEPGQGVAGEIPFREISDVLHAGDRLILNESRVLPARLQTVRTDTGGRVEVLLLRPVDDGQGWLCMARPARRLRPGLQLRVMPPPGGNSRRPPILNILRRGNEDEDGQIVVGTKTNLATVAEQWGVMPLPPYIQRAESDQEQDTQDRARYQTVYAQADETGAGSVAAPTAGLHFSEATLLRLTAMGVSISRVSLHVGPGTFKPPSEEQIESRRLHREFFQMPATTSLEISDTRAAGGRVIAVGTTALRVLETVARLGLPDNAEGVVEFELGNDSSFCGEARAIAGSWEVLGETRLFISPPDRITAADGLLTNFHLPESSLLMLVAALMGDDIWRDVYAHAVQKTMNFYSYGDCMLILPGAHAAPE